MIHFPTTTADDLRDAIDTICGEKVDLNPDPGDADGLLETLERRLRAGEEVPPIGREELLRIIEAFRCQEREIATLQGEIEGLESELDAYDGDEDEDEDEDEDGCDCCDSP